MTQYKTVALGTIETTASLFISDKQVATTLAPVSKKIQDEAVGGWKLHSLVQVPVKVKPGCIGKLFKQDTAYIYYCMLVFEKEA